MQKHLISAVLSIVLLFYGTIYPYAESVPIVDKSQLIYEVISFDIDSESLVIRGFAFLIDTQHFLSDNTHSIQLEFKSTTNSFLVNTLLTDIDQTELMKYQGTSRCNSNYQNDRACYYDYKNVGFEARVDLNQLQYDQDYVVYLVVHAYNANRSAKIPLFCPMSNDLTIDNNTEQITVKSRLDSTNLTIIADTVFARNEPYKNSTVLKDGQACSLTYGNTAYFKKDTIYHNVINKAFVNNTSYYQVIADLSVCSNQRRRITEGSSYAVWIAGVFCNYSGQVMTIRKNYMNARPTINGPNYIELYVNDSFKISDYFSANDREDGDLSTKIKMISGDISTSIEHQSKLLLQVKDSANQATNKEVLLNVIKRPNTAPVIFAEDIKVYQYEEFDPYLSVNVYDKEEGDLTKKLKIVSNDVDTETLGIYHVQYYVSDKENESTSKIITVEVIENPNVTKTIRFIDSHNCIASINKDALNWKNHLQELQIECTALITLSEINK